MANPGWQAEWICDYMVEYYGYFVSIACGEHRLLLLASDDTKGEDLKVGHEIAQALNDSGVFPPDQEPDQ